MQISLYLYIWGGGSGSGGNGVSLHMRTVCPQTIVTTVPIDISEPPTYPAINGGVVMAAPCGGKTLEVE